MTPSAQTRRVDPQALLRRAPALGALGDGSLERGELEARLGISRATSHRHTRWLRDRGLVQRIDGEFHVTPVGRAVATSISEFEAEVETAFLLAPVVDALDAIGLTPPLGAFADATVTHPDGNPYGPMARYASLVRETGALRGFDTWTIAPTYMDEIQARILDGMQTELIDPIPMVEDLMENYPERCVQVCVSGNLVLRLHDELPFGLAIFDDRVGVAVDDPDTGTLTGFVDTDSPAVRDWAKAVYEHYRAESVLLEEFTKNGLRAAVTAA
ncbi:MAG: helix-turn-helix transcriptional regulator [Haloarculaceae archaeon]